jgi:hypothetical protein
MARDGETGRLILQPLRIEDAPQIQELFPHWEVVRYLKNRVPWPYPQDGAQRYIRDFALPAIAKENQWTWTLRPKSHPHQIIGAIDLRRGDENNRGFWMGGPGAHDRSLRVGERLLVSHARLPPVAHIEGRSQRAVAPHLRETRHAPRRNARERIRLRPPAHRGLGDHGGRVERVEGQQYKKAETQTAQPVLISELRVKST